MTTHTSFTMVIQPTTYGLPNGVQVPVFCKITFDGRKLSITGVEGPKRNGDAFGGCGQIQLDPTYAAEGWTPALVAKLAETWERWHLNDMRAGCEHQRAEGWDKRPIDPSKPTHTYGKHFAEQRYDSWNMLVWVSRKEHPEGLLSEPCPTCSYKYGSAWLFEEIPADVLEFLHGLPDATTTPAWV